MCGIVGFVNPNNKSASWGESLSRMTATLTHRGPDDEGYWLDSDAGVALGHRRLSIVDLSPEGRQPMSSASHRYQLSFNGEVYNFLELRKELEIAGHSFRGHSDTEVMLAAFDQWGIEQSVKRFVGMFAFAVWDREERALTLARDRLGEKPLYYGWMGETFLFSSELKALRAHEDWRGEIDTASVALFLKYNYIPAPHSIYKDVYKLLPGSMLTIKVDDAVARRSVEPLVYWSARACAEDGIRDPFKGTEREAVEALDRLLRDSVSRQMVADVPLGAFLSGGIDSSTVVALMQSLSTRPVRTFTIGFNEQGYDETAHARAVAAHLGTAHTELYVTPEEAMAVIPKLAEIYDEPFSDASQIPTFLVSAMACRHVTVSLSGDGGDELFGGYKRYEVGKDWNRITRVPRIMRHTVARIIEEVPAGAWNNLLAWASPLLDRYRADGSIADRLQKAAEVLKVATPEMMYQRAVAQWKDPSLLIESNKPLATAFDDPERVSSFADFSQWMMLADTVSYLPDDILVKLDRASMATSLESRVPMLDYRIVEFAWRLPLNMKIRGRQGKWLLRQLLYKYLPASLIERPKMGFAVPLGNWLREPLREWAEALLDEKRLRESGLNPQPIRQKWAEHLSGRLNWQGDLWAVLMLRQWMANS